MKSKDFISILDLGDNGVEDIVRKASRIKRGDTPRALEGKTVALLFEKPSLRTRVSFEVGIRQMGGTCIFLSNTEIGLGAREPVPDIAKVLDRLVDCIVA